MDLNLGPKVSNNELLKSRLDHVFNVWLRGHPYVQSVRVKAGITKWSDFQSFLENLDEVNAGKNRRGLTRELAEEDYDMEKLSHFWWKRFKHALSYVNELQIEKGTLNNGLVDIRGVDHDQFIHYCYTDPPFQAFSNDKARLREMERKLEEVTARADAAEARVKVLEDALALEVRRNNHILRTNSTRESTNSDVTRHKHSSASKDKPSSDRKSRDKSSSDRVATREHKTVGDKSSSRSSPRPSSSNATKLRSSSNKANQSTSSHRISSRRNHSDRHGEQAGMHRSFFDDHSDSGDVESRRLDLLRREHDFSRREQEFIRCFSRCYTPSSQKQRDRIKECLESEKQALQVEKECLKRQMEKERRKHSKEKERKKHLKKKSKKEKKKKQSKKESRRRYRSSSSDSSSSSEPIRHSKNVHTSRRSNNDHDSTYSVHLSSIGEEDPTDGHYYTDDDPETMGKEDGETENVEEQYEETENGETEETEHGETDLENVDEDEFEDEYDDEYEGHWGEDW